MPRYVLTPEHDRAPEVRLVAAHVLALFENAQRYLTKKQLLHGGVPTSYRFDGTRVAFVQQLPGQGRRVVQARYAQDDTSPAAACEHDACLSDYVTRATEKHGIDFERVTEVPQVAYGVPADFVCRHGGQFWVRPKDADA